MTDKTKILTILTGKEFSKHDALSEANADALPGTFELLIKGIILMISGNGSKRIRSQQRIKQRNFHILFRRSVLEKCKATELA